MFAEDLAKEVAEEVDGIGEGHFGGRGKRGGGGKGRKGDWKFGRIVSGSGRVEWIIKDPAEKARSNSSKTEKLSLFLNMI
ncbi:MAG: hypothetical protein Fur0022_34070 [Anaerolineales bacterium]